MKVFLVALVAVAALLAPAAADAGDAGWTPGACKTTLTHYGIPATYGYFTATAGACVGYGGRQSCFWNASHTARLYKSFFILALTRDGTVRTAKLNVTGTGPKDGRVSGVKIYARGVSYSSFQTRYMPIAWQLAAEENQKGCG